MKFIPKLSESFLVFKFNASKLLFNKILLKEIFKIENLKGHGNLKLKWQKLKSSVLAVGFEILTKVKEISFIYATNKEILLVTLNYLRKLNL